MTKRTAFLAALAAAATLFLAACNQAGSAAGSKEDTSNAAGGNAQQVAGGEQPVDCGEVEVNHSTQKLIAVQANGGIVGCTEAFNVLDEYLTKGTAELSGGWACAPDDALVACVKGDAQDPAGLGFHTEQADEATKPVDCGEIDVDGRKHMLTAQPTEDGLVGCTEAFNVIDEYLKIPVRDRDLNGTDLSEGWKCTTDDGETAGIGCVQNDTDPTLRFAFSTTPM